MPHNEPFDAGMACRWLDLSEAAGLLLVACVREVPRGFIAGTLAPLLAAQGLQAVELAFWVDPSVRGGVGRFLVAEFEKRAAALGASYVHMIAIDAGEPDAARRLYERRGYQKLETAYFKRVEATDEED